MHFKYLTILFVNYSAIKLKKSTSVVLICDPRCISHDLQAWRQLILGGGPQEQEQSAAWREGRSRCHRNQGERWSLLQALTYTSQSLHVITGYHQWYPVGCYWFEREGIYFWRGWAQRLVTEGDFWGRPWGLPRILPGKVRWEEGLIRTCFLMGVTSGDCPCMGGSFLPLVYGLRL